MFISQTTIELKIVNRKKWIFNSMTSLLIGILGVFFSSFQSTADKIAFSFGRGSTLVGLFISIFAAGSFISVFFSGTLADYIGKKKVIIAAIISSIIGSLLIAASQWYGLTLLGLFLMGMGFGPAEAMSSAVMTDENPTQATKWMNISQIMYCVGAITAPIAAVWYCTKGGGRYNDIFFLCSVIFAFLLIYFSSARLSIVQTADKIVIKEIQPLTLLKDKRFMLYAAMIFLYIGYDSMGPVYIKQFFLDTYSTEQVAATGISVFWIAMIAGRIIGALLNGKERLGVRFFTPFVILGILLLLIAGNEELRFVAAFLYGFGCGPVWPMMFVLSSKVFPERSGAAYAVMMLFSSAGHMLFPALLGSWVGNVRLTFVGCGVLAILVFCGSLLIGKSNRV